MNWEEVELGNIAEIILGGTPSTQNKAYWNGLIPWISVTDFKDNKHIISTEKTITDIGLNNSNTKIVPSGSIIISARGTVGKIVVCKKQMAFNQSCYAILSKNNLYCSQDFLYYILKSASNRLKQNTHGAVFDTIIKVNLENLKLNLPTLPIQKKIASILSAYDDLIENNIRRIELLEKAARELYKEWFVRFRFPGHEKARFKDGLPEMWERKKLGEVASIIMGQSPKSMYYNTEGKGLPFHQGVTNFGNRYVKHEKYSTSGNRITYDGDILCSVRAPVGRLNIAPSKLILGRGLAGIKSKKNNQSFLYYQLQSYFFKENIIGTGAIFAAVTKEQMHFIEIIMPTESIISAFEKITNPIDKQIRYLTEQNKLLKQSRDLLLPRLMKGEIEV
ncbi:MAG: restriction endonuclease subunit S [Spirochaetales bacterium]|nr:restriction endonuclease subunit S [Spirochaetales bacterium]